MPTEADTCRTLILPRLYAAGWTDDQLAEQRIFTDGRIIVHGQRLQPRPSAPFQFSPVFILLPYPRAC